MEDEVVAENLEKSPENIDNSPSVVENLENPQSRRRTDALQAQETR